MLPFLLTSCAAAVLTYLAIRAMFPLLERYALARPNARSSHKVPTAQGGGAAVVPVTLLVWWLALVVLPAGTPPAIALPHLLGVSLATLVLAILGAFDDIRPLPVLPRLAAQFAAALVLVLAVPADARALPVVPGLIETAILVVGLVWFINLTNFMDGIDWMTVVEKVPVCAGLAILAAAGALPAEGGLLAISLLGALVGFAPYNRHVARLFLGDVGSLAIGALVGWLLILLATGGHLAAALLLPLYYLLDANITLYRRWRRGERLSQAHRSHFYQIATTKGLTVPTVTARVFAVNVALVALAVASVLAGSRWADLGFLVIGLALTAAVLRTFAIGKR